MAFCLQSGDIKDGIVCRGTCSLRQELYPLKKSEPFPSRRWLELTETSLRLTGVLFRLTKVVFKLTGMLQANQSDIQAELENILVGYKSCI